MQLFCRWANGAKKYYRAISVIMDAENWQEEALMNARNSKAKFVLLLKVYLMSVDSSDFKLVLIFSFCTDKFDAVIATLVIYY